MRRRALLALLPLAACASPPAELFTLRAVPGPVVKTRDRRLELRRVGLAGYLDRPEIVRTADTYRLRVADAERWGEPLGRMLDRVLAENLVQRLPDVAVYAETGAISTQPDGILEVEVQRFDADATGAVTLLAQVALRNDGSRVPATARTFRLAARPAGPGTLDLVAAMSAVLGELADAIARMVAGGR
jgi:uncharacterized lipoprotein YmbA